MTYNFAAAALAAAVLIVSAVVPRADLTEPPHLEVCPHGALEIRFDPAGQVAGLWYCDLGGWEAVENPDRVWSTTRGPRTLKP